MRIGLQRDTDRPSLNRSGFHSNFNRNKRSMTANLYHPKGREAVERLLAVSDVVIENYSAGAFARMGFPWEHLQEINPSLIYVSVSGFGHVGRRRLLSHLGPQRPGHLRRHRHVRPPGPAPAGWGFSYLDHSAGYYAAIAVLMALPPPRRTGEAQHVDMAQIEAGMVVSAVPMLDYQVNGRTYERIGTAPASPPRPPTTPIPAPAMTAGSPSPSTMTPNGPRSATSSASTPSATPPASRTWPPARLTKTPSTRPSPP